MNRLLSIIPAYFLLLASTVFGQQQKIDAPINAEGRTLSFHLYHFNSDSHSIQIQKKTQKLAQALDPQKQLAAVSVNPMRSGPDLSANNGKISLSSNAPSIHIGSQLLAQRKIKPALDNTKLARRTFLLHNGKNRWAIGYAPAVSQLQLATALASISKKSNFDYLHAFQLNAGKQSAFWVSKKSHLSFYLKEINAPAAILIISKKS